MYLPCLLTRDGKDVRGGRPGFKPHVVCLTPPEGPPGKRVRNVESRAHVDAERGTVEPDCSLTSLVRIEVNDYQHSVVRRGPSCREVDALRETQYLRLVWVVKAQVAELVQGRMRSPDRVEPRDK